MILSFDYVEKVKAEEKTPAAESQPPNVMPTVELSDNPIVAQSQPTTNMPTVEPSDNPNVIESQETSHPFSSNVGPLTQGIKD